MASIDYGVKFIPSNGSEVHTHDNWGCYFSAAPVYSTRKPKYSIIEIPYSNDVLDFSRIDNGRLYFSESTFTYNLVYVSKASGDQKETDIRAKQNTIDSFCWDFQGSLHDDYMGTSKQLKNARCTSLTFTPDYHNGVLQITMVFQGKQ